MIAALVLTAAIAFSPLADSPPDVSIPKNHPNQTGIADSAYTGRYYLARMEPYRKCVAQREGRGQYWTTGSNGYYLGTYQMTAALTRGAVWMMTKELRATYGDREGRKVRDRLHNTKPTKWNRYYWDMAFWTVLNWEAPGSGAHHWAGGRFSCQTSMLNSGGAR